MGDDMMRALGKVLAVVQARVSSTRLPGKVLMPILGQPMLLRQIERVRRAATLDRIVVATSTEPGDDRIEHVCYDAGVEVFRGSLDDVLDRFYRAACAYGPEHVVRLTADCPLADPRVIDAVVALHLEGGYDYTSNVAPPTFPDGLDVEVMRLDVLEEAWREAKAPFHREHVTQYILAHPERFRLGLLVRERDLSGLRWTVDEPADFDFVTGVYERLYAENPAFDTEDILALLDREPSLAARNASLKRNESLSKQVADDQGT